MHNISRMKSCFTTLKYTYMISWFATHRSRNRTLSDIKVSLIARIEWWHNMTTDKCTDIKILPRSDDNGRCWLGGASWWTGRVHDGIRWQCRCWGSEVLGLSSDVLMTVVMWRSTDYRITERRCVIHANTVACKLSWKVSVRVVTLSRRLLEMATTTTTVVTTVDYLRLYVNCVTIATKRYSATSTQHARVQTTFVLRSMHTCLSR